MADDTKTIYQVKLQISKLNESIRDQEEEIKNLKGAALKKAKEKLAEDKKDLSILRQTANLEKEMLDLSNEISMLEEDISFYRQKQADFAGDIGKNIQEQVESIPLIGASLSKNLQLDELSEALKAKQLLATTDIKMTDEERAALQEKINLLTKANPIMFIVGALALLVAYLKQTVSLSQELNTSFMQTAALQPSINAASLMLVGTGQDASKIAGEMLDAFGSVDNITASAIRRVGHLSTKLGASSENIIKILTNQAQFSGLGVYQFSFKGLMAWRIWITRSDISDSAL